MFVQRLQERRYHLRRWGEAPLAVLLEPLPLRQKVEAEGMDVALALHEQVAPDQGKAHTGHALQAFVGRGGDSGKGDPSGVQGERPKGAHGVDDQGHTP